MKNESLVCKAPLVYLEKDEEMIGRAFCVVASNDCEAVKRHWRNRRAALL